MNHDYQIEDAKIQTSIPQWQVLEYLHSGSIEKTNTSWITHAVKWILLTPICFSIDICINVLLIIYNGIAYLVRKIFEIFWSLIILLAKFIFDILKPFFLPIMFGVGFLVLIFIIVKFKLLSMIF